MLYLSKKKQNICTTLHSFSRTFKAVQADIAYIIFYSKIRCQHKISFIICYLFTSKIYTYPLKKRNLLAKKKKELFYKDIENKKIGQNEVTNRSRI